MSTGYGVVVVVVLLVLVVVVVVVVVVVIGGGGGSEQVGWNLFRSNFKIVTQGSPALNGDLCKWAGHGQTEESVPP